MFFVYTYNQTHICRKINFKLYFPLCVFRSMAECQSRQQKKRCSHSVYTVGYLATSIISSPPSYFMNIRELMLAGRESRKGLGQREKERLVREASVGRGRVRRADIVTGPGSAQALNELGWLPIDWKTTGCRRTDKGVCGLTGEGRDTDQSSHYTSPPWILLSLCFFTLEWMRLLLLISGFCCEGRCLFFFSEKILPTHHARTKTAPLTTGNLSSCLHSNPDVCSSSPSRYSGPSFASCYHLCLVTMVSSLLSLPHYLFFSLPLMSWWHALAWFPFLSWQ